MSEVQFQQVLIPKKVYIGDTAELRITFNSEDQEIKALTSDGIIDLTDQIFEEEVDSDLCQIIKIQLAPAGVNYYQLSVFFNPWKTGNLAIPSLNIGKTQIVPKEFTISSILEQTGASSLRENSGPLLLPGTSYKIYGSLIVLVLILFTIIRIIVKREKLLFFIRNRQLQRKYKKNHKKTVKMLKKLRKLNCSDSDFAQKFQHILRNYLEIRFGFPFTKAASSELMKGFYTATGNVLDEQKEEAFSQIVSTFIRTDFIRYSSESAFLDGEKNQLVENVIKNIGLIESPAKKEVQ